MIHLLNLVAAIALLVRGAQIVRTGVLRVSASLVAVVFPAKGSETSSLHLDLIRDLKRITPASAASRIPSAQPWACWRTGASAIRSSLRWTTTRGTGRRQRRRP
jgi:hypothetical protein